MCENPFSGLKMGLNPSLRWQFVVPFLRLFGSIRWRVNESEALLNNEMECEVWILSWGWFGLWCSEEKGLELWWKCYKSWSDVISRRFLVTLKFVAKRPSVFSGTLESEMQFPFQVRRCLFFYCLSSLNTSSLVTLALGNHCLGPALATFMDPE